MGNTQSTANANGVATIIEDFPRYGYPYNYQGCYKQDSLTADYTLLNKPNEELSSLGCIFYCQDNLQQEYATCFINTANECWGSHTTDMSNIGTEVDDSLCTAQCTGSTQDMSCGGPDGAVLVYSTAAVPVDSKSSTAASDSSSTISTTSTSSAVTPAETTPAEDTTPQISQAIDGYTYSGCYTDAFTPDGLSSLGRGFQTADACVEACAEAGAAACHVHIEWCYSSSGTDYPSSFPTALSNSYCSEPCYEDAEQSCGADSGRLYYVLGDAYITTSAASGPSSTATDVSSTASSDSSSATSGASSDSVAATSTTNSAATASSPAASDPTATIVTHSGDWSYKKCVHPNTYINPLALGETTSVEACLDLCSTSRYVDAVSDEAYITCFVTGTGTCAAATMQWEDAIREGYKIGDEDCVGSPCAGDVGESCGGSAGQLVYALPEATTTTTTSSATATSEAASSTPTATPVEASGKVTSDPDWNYVGCYTDSVSARTLVNGLGSQDWTAQNCLSLAAAAGYRYAGIIYGGECWGANEITTGIEQDASACTWRCANNEEGDATTCGGEAGLDVYETTLPVSTTTTTSATASPSSAAPAKESKAGWTYAGCFSDLRDARSVPNHLDTSPWTAETCLTAAQDAGYQVAGIIYGGECWGAYSVASTAVSLDADQCQWKCNNDETTYCGGESALDVYVFDLATKFVADKEWSYTGCYTDSISARTLPHGLGSQHWDIQTCLDLATAAEFKYAGIIYGGECWGANEIASTGTVQSLSKCNWDCNDARGVETCGGEAGLDVYQDYLSSLPPELLTKIFKLAYEGNITTTGALSRTLLPYPRAEKLKEVKVETPGQLVKLANVSKKSTESHLGVHVKRVAAHCTGTTVDKDCVELLFSSFTALHGFTLFVTKRDVAETVLSIAMTHSGSSISAVSLTIYGQDGVKSSSPIWQQLSSFRASTLRLNLAVNGRGLEPSAASLISLPHVKNLSLVCDAVSSPFIALILLPLLPASLSSLSFVTPFYFEGYMIGTLIDHFLPRCARLKHLHLGEGTFDNGKLAANLRALASLSSLSFGPGTRFDAWSFSSLVCGPQRHPSLKHLILDSVPAGKRGWSFKTTGRLHPEHGKNPYHVAPGWKAPPYDSEANGGEFTASGIKELVFDCKRGGVAVDGTAIKGAHVYHDWLEEVQACMLAYAASKRYSPAVFREVETKLNELMDREHVGSLLEGVMEEMEFFDEEY
ncbi:hypothetical protein JCM8547_003568 [Rhodosporidiobolus lusitaniae]